MTSQTSTLWTIKQVKITEVKAKVHKSSKTEYIIVSQSKGGGDSSVVRAAVS